VSRAASVRLLTSTGRGIGTLVLALLALLVSTTAIVGYSRNPVDALVAPGMQAPFRDNRIAVYLHVFGAALAPVIGLVQLSRRARRRWPMLHRWLGRFYLSVCVLVGGLAGFYLGFHAFGGWITRFAFIVLALTWLSTGLFAYRAIRRGDVASHQAWMWRNYSITWGAVTLRLYMGIAQEGLGFTFEQSYPVVAWLCFVPNIVVAEWLLRRRVATRGLTASGAASLRTP
jgi:uncharacterized membrane protein